MPRSSRAVGRAVKEATMSKELTMRNGDVEEVSPDDQEDVDDEEEAEE